MARFCDSISAPSVLIFDWHGTLVDTHDAMFSAMEDMLPQLEDLGLVERLVLPLAKTRAPGGSGAAAAGLRLPLPCSRCG